MPWIWGILDFRSIEVLHTILKNGKKFQWAFFSSSPKKHTSHAIDYIQI
jgi:hypothetical protein